MNCTFPYKCECCGQRVNYPQGIATMLVIFLIRLNGSCEYSSCCAEAGQQVVQGVQVLGRLIGQCAN